jgi:hypothetical protein
VPRVAAVILHPRAEPDAGPLTRAFAAVRRRNADRHAAGFEALGATTRVLDDLHGGTTFGERIRELVAALRPDGLILMGSGSIPLATQRDRRAFVDAARGRARRALANNRYSADVIAVSGAARLAGLPDLIADNGLPRWLAEEAGFKVEDLLGRWRLQVDLDSPLDAMLIRPADAEPILAAADIDLGAVRSRLAAVANVVRDPRCELLVAGRTSASGLAWLERSTASRTRALVEERGMKTRRSGQRPTRSSLGFLLDRDGPEAFGPRLAELADAALIDTRVLLAHRFGAEEAGWPVAEDRYASDLLLVERIDDPWLRALTASVRDAAIPVVLGGHTLVGPGLRLAIRGDRRWT